MIKTTCKFCGSIRLFDDSLEGQRIECLGCGFPVKVSHTEPVGKGLGINPTEKGDRLAGEAGNTKASHFTQISPVIPQREVEKNIIEPPAENPPSIITAGTEEQTNLQTTVPGTEITSQSTVTDYSTIPTRSKPKQKTAVIILAILAVSAAAFYLLSISEGQEDVIITPATGFDSATTTSNTVSAPPLTADSNSTKIADTGATNTGTFNEINSPGNNATTKETEKRINKEPVKDDLHGRTFMFLSQGQIKNDLLNKPLCEGLVYTGYNQKLSTTGSFPGKEFQRKLYLYSNITITMRFSDEAENRTCIVEVFYKKDENRFDLITYAEK